MKHLTHKKIKTLTLGIIFSLSFVLVLSVAFVTSVSQSAAQTPPALSSARTTLTSALGSLQSASSSLIKLTDKTSASLSQVLTVATLQGLSATGVIPAQLTSPSALNPDAATTLVSNAIKGAVATGTVTLTQVTKATAIPIAAIQSLAATAVAQGVSAGTISLTQLSSISTAGQIQIQNLILTAVDQAIAAGTINLNQVQTVSGVTANQLNTIVTTAVAEAVASGTALTSTQQLQIVNQAIASINRVTGVLSVSAIQNAVAQEVVNVAGAGNAVIIAAALSNSTVVTFQTAVRDVLSVTAMTQIGTLPGTVDLGMIKNVIANSAISTTGLGTAGTIVNSFGGSLGATFSSIVNDAVVNQAVNAIASLTGVVDLASAQTAIAGSILSSTGLGNITSITGAFSSQTTTAFTNAIQSALITQATDALQTLTGAVSIVGIQDSIAASVAALSGLGTASTISASLVGIDTNAISLAIQQSIVLNSIDSLDTLSNLSAFSIQNLIATEIINITGSGTVTAITGAIDVNIATAIGSIAGVEKQLFTLQNQLGAQLAIALDLSKTLSSSILNNLSAVDISGIVTQIGSIQTGALSMVGTVTGGVTSAISSITSIASGIFSSGVLSATGLTNLTSAVTSFVSASTAVGSTIGIVTGAVTTVTTVTSHRGGPGGTPFGGRSTRVFFCNCTGNLAVWINDLTISPGVSLPLIYQPGGTKLYPYGQIFRPGVWTLGLWRPGGVCLYFRRRHCRYLPTAGTMSIVGTSM